MDRITLQTQLSAYRSPYEEENQFVPDFLALTEDPLAYSRERTTGHFTASAWIVTESWEDGCSWEDMPTGTKISWK